MTTRSPGAPRRAPALLLAGLAALCLAGEPTPTSRAGTVPGARPPAPAAPGPGARADAPAAATAAALPRVLREYPADAHGPRRLVLPGRDLGVALTASAVHWLVAGADADGAPLRAQVDLVPVGAARVEPVGVREAAARITRFRGGADVGSRSAVTWHGAVYPALWPGVDLHVDVDGDAAKSTFRVAPGGDPSVVRYVLDGATSARVDEAGRLVVTTPAGEVVDEAPVAWTDDGAPVAVAYDLDPATLEVGFTVAPYDVDRTLHLDPAVLSQAGWFGGAERDELADVAVGPDGSLYLCGWTDSDASTFPVLAGPGLTYSGDLGSFGDAFVARIDPTGTTLLWAGYIGGTESDFANSLAVDATGRVVVGGHTRSDSSTEGFPATGPDATFGGSVDGWLARVSADGTTLDWCTYIGGTGHEDRTLGVAVDGAGRAYAVGRSNTSDGSFGPVVGPSLGFGGIQDAFVGRVAADGSAFDYLGFVGDDTIEDGSAIAVADDGTAWICGYDSAPGVPADAFVARIAPDGTAVEWTLGIGGDMNDLALHLDVDALGRAHVGGTTFSDEGSFPVAVGPDLTYNGTAFVQDAWVARVAADGGGLDWCGYVGGSDFDSLAGVAVAPSGAVWIAGWTASTEASPAPFPVVVGPDLTHHGVTDAYVGAIAPSGLGFEFLGFLGGPDDDTVASLALVPPAGEGDGTVSAWLGGTATATTFPVSVGPDLVHNGMSDVLVAKVTATTAPEDEPTFTLTGRKGRLKDATKAGKDAFRWTGDLDFLPASPDMALDPTVDALLLSAGPAAAPVVVAVPAGDPGWKVTKKGFSWRSAKGSTPRVKLRYKAKKGRLSVKISKADFRPPAALPIDLELTLGDDTGTAGDTWAAAKKAGLFKLQRP